jgi:hypothetical protein
MKHTAPQNQTVPAAQKGTPGGAVSKFRAAQVRP